MRIESIAVKDNLSFDDDLCNRKPTGEGLSDLVSNMSNGGVISLDGGWGEGKTTFIKMWLDQYQEQLGASGKAIYFDAFERDYVEDPFLPIVARLLEASKTGLHNETGQKDGAAPAAKLATGAVKAARLLAVGALKNGVANVSGGLVTPELIDESLQALSSKAEGGLDAALLSQLDKYMQHDQSIREFKAALRDWVRGYGRVVFIVDELDRCKPNFAVSLLERLKHFFDVPGIVFVLVMNRSQLEHAVNGLYGSRINAEGYLSKFVHFFLKLPKAIGSENVERARGFARQSLSRVGFDGSSELDLDLTAQALVLFDCSLREAESLCSLIALVRLRQRAPTGLATRLIPFLCVLRMKQRMLFESLQANKINRKELTTVGERLAPFRGSLGIVKYYHLIACFFGINDDESKALIPEEEIQPAFTFRRNLTADYFPREPGALVVALCRRIALVA